MIVATWLWLGIFGGLAFRLARRHGLSTFPSSCSWAWLTGTPRDWGSRPPDLDMKSRVHRRHP